MPANAVSEWSERASSFVFGARGDTSGEFLALEVTASGA